MISAPVFCPDFVGRRTELAFLIERRRDLGKAHGGLILVGGDAGIGKSRLIRDFLGSTGVSRGRVATGRCRPYASAPYDPLAELLAVLAPAAAPLSPAQSQDAQLKASRCCGSLAPRSSTLLIRTQVPSEHLMGARERERPVREGFTL